MKKYLALIITVVIISLSLCVPAFAVEKEYFTLSEDYKLMYLGGETYTRVDASMLTYTYVDCVLEDGYEEEFEEDYEYIIDSAAPVNYNSLFEAKLTPEQQAEVEAVEITDVNSTQTLFFICISFNDGSELYINFIREDMIDEYQRVVNGETKEYYIDFRWPEDNQVTAKKEKLTTGKKELIDFVECDMDFPVYASSTKGGFNAEVGAIIVFGEKYYYYSFINSSIKTLDELWMYNDLQLEAYLITDEAFIAELEQAKQAYYGDDYGFLYDDELTQAVAKIFFILAFALAPLGIAITTLVFAIKVKKGLYKKLLFTTSALSLASVGMFIWVAFMLFK